MSRILLILIFVYICSASILLKEYNFDHDVITSYNATTLIFDDVLFPTDNFACEMVFNVSSEPNNMLIFIYYNKSRIFNSICPNESSCQSVEKSIEIFPLLYDKSSPVVIISNPNSNTIIEITGTVKLYRSQMHRNWPKSIIIFGTIFVVTTMICYLAFLIVIFYKLRHDTEFQKFQPIN